MRKSKHYMMAVFLLLTAVFSFSHLHPLSADAKETVRVGYYDQNRLSSDANETFYGYMTEYLNKIAQYADIDYEYVYGSWAQCMDWLSSGEIDLMFPVEYTPERAQKFDFCRHDGGLGYFGLYTYAGNRNLYYDDYASFNGINVGLLDGVNANAAFEAYAAEHQLQVNRIYYASNTELNNALLSHEVDAIVNGSMAKTDGQKILAKFQVSPVYMITRKGNTRLLTQLNDAADRLSVDSPYYCGMLQEKYFGESSQTVTGITREEAEYAKNHGPLRVVCDPNHYPVSYYNEKKKEFEGVYPDYMRLFAKQGGLDIEFTAADDLEQGRQMIEQGQADILVGIYPNEQTAPAYHLDFLPEFSQERYYILANDTDRLSDPSALTVALPDTYIDYQYFISLNYPSWNIQSYPTEQDCISAVKSRGADITLVNAASVQAGNQSNTYRGLYIVPGIEISIPICLGIRSDLSPLMLSFLRKQSQLMRHSDLDRLITDNAVKASKKLSLSYIIQTTVPFAAGAFLLIFTISLLIVKKQEKYYQRLAVTDSLTGLYNRRKFIAEADKLLAENKNKSYAMICIDIDKFRNINITFGYTAGDEILLQLTENMKTIFPAHALFGRSMADKFAVFTEHDDYLLNRLQKLCDFRYAIHKDGPKNVQISLKIGVREIYPADCLSAASYIDHANLSKTVIKGIYDKNISFYNDEIAETAERENLIEAAMNDAVKNHDFVVYYQPKYNLQTKQVIGAEALVRWKLSDGRLLPPSEFLPLFEKNCFILTLDFYVYETVLRMLRERLEQRKPIVPISVNVSRMHIGTDDFFPKMRELLEKYDISPDMLELEITESALGTEDEHALHFLNKIKEMGFTISIDDFGSGYSSFNLLKNMPVDVLKIDKKFLEESAASYKTKVIIRKIIEMSKDLRIKTICEGVETQGQSAFLEEIGCDAAQGYLFARPLPEDEFTRLL